MQIRHRLAEISALNVDSNIVRFKRSFVYDGIKFQDARFLLLSSNLARVRLQIDTDLLLIITGTAGDLSGGTNIDDLE